MTEVDLRQRVEDFQLGRSRKVRSEYPVTEESPNEHSLINFLKASVVQVSIVKSALENSPEIAQIHFRNADSRPSLELSLRGVLDNDEFDQVIPEWEEKFNLMLLQNRTLEEFEGAGGTLLSDISEIHKVGTEWFTTQKPKTLALSASK